jgi:hypothetical protein
VLVLPARLLPRHAHARAQRERLAERTLGAQHGTLLPLRLQQLTSPGAPLSQVEKGAKQAGLSKDDFLRKEKEAQMRNEKKQDKKEYGPHCSSAVNLLGVAKCSTGFDSQRGA